jgi:hypothetical protein
MCISLNRVLLCCCRSAEFVAEGIATLNRRMAAGPADNWFASNLYPKYYADNTFHYQSDGWMSDRCAECIGCTLSACEA